MNTILLLAILDVTIIVPIAMAATVAFTVFLLMDGITSSQHKAERRLQEFNGEADGVMIKESPFATFMAETAPKFGKSLQPKKKAELNKLQERLSHAGFRTDEAFSRCSDSEQYRTCGTFTDVQSMNLNLSLAILNE